jgi:hypothetical protein
MKKKVTIKEFGSDAVSNEEGILFEVLFTEKGFRPDVKLNRGRANYARRWFRDSDGMLAETFLYDDTFKGGAKSWIRIRDRFNKTIGNWNPRDWNGTEEWVSDIVG